MQLGLTEEQINVGVQGICDQINELGPESPYNHSSVGNCYVISGLRGLVKVIATSIPGIERVQGSPPKQRESRLGSVNTGDAYWIWPDEMGPRGGLHFTLLDSVTSDIFPDSQALDIAKLLTAKFKRPNSNPRKFISELDRGLFKAANDNARLTGTGVSLTETGTTICELQNSDVGWRVSDGRSVMGSPPFEEKLAYREFEEPLVRISQEILHEPDPTRRQMLINEERKMITETMKVKFDSPNGYGVVGHGAVKRGLSEETLQIPWIKEGMSLMLYTDGFGDMARVLGVDPYALGEFIHRYPDLIDGAVNLVIKSLQKKIPEWVHVRHKIFDDSTLVTAKSIGIDEISRLRLYVGPNKTLRVAVR
jgi:hypothetical protein